MMRNCTTTEFLLGILKISITTTNMNPSKNPVTVAVLGAGQRGEMFGQILKRSEHLAKVTAVAEPREEYRRRFAADHSLPPEAVFPTWQEFAARPKLSDAIVIATLDREHAGPALACLEKGYHLFLEKPMATTLEDCQAIVAAQRKSGAIAAICHSLRYHKAFAKLKEIIESGRIGRVMTIDQLEPVAFWHQAHAFIRGNWANETKSSPMLLAKSCHDIDYIAFLVGKP